LTFANKELLARYLLGELSAGDRQRLEKEFLADDEVWETLSAVENDLIDSYVRGDLPEEKKWQFEQHFLDTPEKRERLEMARLLMDPAVRQSIRTAPIEKHEKRGSWLEASVEVLWGRHRAMNLGLGVAGLALVVVAAFMVLQNRHLQTELGQLQSQETALQRQIDQLQQQISSLSNPQERNAGGNTGNPGPREPETVAVLLIPGLSRRPGQQNNNVLRIPATASSVVLKLEMKRDPYPQYEVLIETPEGNRVSRNERLKSEPGENGGKVVSLRLPSQLLRKGDYIVTLSGQKPGDGTEILDSYSLSVVR
jgi:hypothetical protein